jgi:hypothetical protein
MPDRDCGERADPVLGEDGGQPRHPGAPVVADDVGLVDAEVVQDRADVADYVAQAVPGDLGRSDRPKPRMSGVMTRYPFATRTGTW